MTSGGSAGSNLWWPDAAPWRKQGTGTASSSGGHINFTFSPYTQQTVVLLGMDAVASGVQPSQMAVSLEAPSGQQVYYDSQSTGEGLGVRWQYRGQIPLHGSETLVFNMLLISGSPIPFYVSCWGLLLPIGQPY